MFWQRAQGNLQLPAGYFGCCFENYAHQWLDHRQKLIGVRLGKGLFIFGRNGSKTLFQMHAPIHGLKSHAKRKNQWNFPSYVAVLPAHRWVQRLLSWHQFGTRRLGRPRHTWESTLHATQKCVDSFTVEIFRCNGYFSGVFCSWSPESVCG